MAKRLDSIEKEIEKLKIEKDYWDDLFSFQGDIYQTIIAIFIFVGGFVAYKVINYKIKKNKEDFKKVKGEINEEIKVFKEDYNMTKTELYDTMVDLYGVTSDLYLKEKLYHVAIVSSIKEIFYTYYNKKQEYINENIKLKNQDYKRTIRLIDLKIEIFKNIISKIEIDKTNIDYFNIRKKEIFIYINKIIDEENNYLRERIIEFKIIIDKLYELIEQNN